jgi:hypothetical protein
LTWLDFFADSTSQLSGYMVWDRVIDGVDVLQDVGKEKVKKERRREAMIDAGQKTLDLSKLARPARLPSPCFHCCRVRDLCCASILSPGSSTILVPENHARDSDWSQMLQVCRQGGRAQRRREADA